MIGELQSDTSVIKKLFGHNAWANLTLLTFCEALDSEQMDSTATGCYGSIRDTLVHIVSGEVDYVNLATEQWPEVIPPFDHFLSFQVLKDGVMWAHDRFVQVAASAHAGTIVRVERPDEPIYEYPLSSFMVQIINHSTEHRTQIATIITQLGLQPPSMSGWAYMRHLDELKEFRPGTRES